MAASGVTREIARGLAGGSGFLAGALLLGTPWWLAALLGAGLYAGLALVWPGPPRPPQPDWVGLGVSREDFERFVARCRAAQTEVQRIAAQLQPGEFRARVEELALTAGALSQYLEQKADRILLAHALPQNLEQLVQMLRQYAELSRFPAPGLSVTEALRKVEADLGDVHLAFQEMYRQLLDNDVAALQASARTLEFLLGVDAAVPRERRNGISETVPGTLALPSASAPPRPRRQERPL